MQKGDLAFDNEGDTDALYVWTGSWWLRIGMVYWCMYWWCCTFLDEHVHISAPHERNRQKCGEYLMEYAHKKNDKLMAYVEAHLPKNTSAELKQAIAERMKS